MSLQYYKIDNIHCVELGAEKLYSEDLNDLLKKVSSINKGLVAQLMRMI